MLKVFRDIWAYRELLLILVGRNIKIRYKRSVLGFFWTFLNPILLIVIYTVFLRILKFYDPANPLFLPMLVMGIIAWQFHAMSLSDSLYTILGNASLVTKTPFPRIVLPLSMVTANLVNFLLTLPIVAIYMALMGMEFSRLWLLPVVVLTQFALCLGFSLILSALNVFFRDVEHLLGIGLLAWFFLSPIIYPFSQIPERFQRAAFVNPLCGIVTCYRSIFLSTDLMAPRLVTMSLGISWMLCLLGISFFQRWQSKFADEL